MFFDVVVVGGGPAGSAAAIVLSKGGSSVLLIDKAEFPRDKCCGDGLTTMALRLSEELGLDIEKLADFQTIDGAVIHSPSRRKNFFPLPDKGIYAAVVPRSDYDSALIDLAISNGVEVKQKHKFISIDFGGRGAFVNIEGLETVETSHVIAADGAWSSVRRAVSNNSPQKNSNRGEWLAFRQYLSNVGPEAEKLHVWFEQDLLPGYAWSFPLPGARANVGFGVLRKNFSSSSDITKLSKNFLKRESLREVLGNNFETQDRLTAWPIPAQVGEKELAHGPVLFVGDAAAATDILTGEGIGQALLTGILAAKTLLTKESHHVSSLNYEKLVKSHLLSDHRMSKILQSILAKPRGTEKALQFAALNDWTKKNFARWMFEDYPRAILFTPKRWRKGVLKLPGAYTLD